VVNGDKLHQQISNLPAWAVPPPAALEAVIRSTTGADNFKWDPMENGMIALKFEHEQAWMACKNMKVYIAYKQCSTLPHNTHIMMHILTLWCRVSAVQPEPPTKARWLDHTTLCCNVLYIF
jgi:hypothetical protein